MNSQAATVLTGQHLGKYQLERVLGSGNMATVYLARDPFMDREVAVKVARASIDDANANEAEFRQLFFNEARTAGSLRHPNIIAIHDAGSERGHSYIVMEYVPGGRTLDDYAQPGQLLPLDQVTAILHQVALALDHAHRHGVIHRDIKPRNILVNAAMEAKVADFGVAVSPGQAPDGEAVLVGSPLYMAPEQIQLEAPTGQSDLFALGIVAYQLLTGHHPFEARNLDAIHYRIQHSRPQPVTAFRDDVPAIFQRILDKALARNRQYRYKTGADLAGDLLLVYEFLRGQAQGPSQQEKFARMRALPLFNGFEESELWELLHTGEWLQLEAGGIHGGLDDPDPSFSIIVDGRLVLAGHNGTLLELGVGDCHGEASAGADGARHSRLVAETPATLLRLRAAVVDRLSVSAQLRFQRNFLHALVGRLDAAAARAAGRPPHGDNGS